MLDYKKIGMRIRMLRKKENMSQRELAERTGLSEKQISRLEGGRHHVSLESLVSIAHVFDQSLDLLALGKEKDSSAGLFENLFEGCSEEERLFLLDMVIALKQGLKALL